MLKEFIDRIVTLGRESARPTRVVTGDPRVERYLTTDGQTVSFDIPTAPREHKAKTLDEIVALAKRFSDESALPDNDYSPVVWYNEDAVMLVIDDGGHRLETATLDLVPSDVFGEMRRLAQSKPWYDQKSFVRLLKVDLIGTLPPGALLNVVARVKFENGTVTQGEVKKARESMSREVTAAASAEGEVPDDVTFSVPVYKTMGERNPFPLRCTVEIDPMQARFRLMPFPDEVERVQQLAMASIAERLLGGLPENVPAYYGSNC